MGMNPDAHAAGIIDTTPQALRYDWCSDDPAEVAGILRDLMPQRSRVLDIGCGTGAVTLAANRDKDNDLYGIEPDPTRATVIVLHPGPMNRGVEITPEVADSAQSCVLEQVTNGIAVRMSLLFLLTAGPAEENLLQSTEAQPKESAHATD